MRGSLSPCWTPCSPLSSATPRQKRSNRNSNTRASSGERRKTARAAACTCARRRTSTSASAVHSNSSWSTLAGRPAARSPRPKPTAASQTRSSGRFAMILAAGALAPALHHALHALARLEQSAQRLVGNGGLDLVPSERVERLRPVERLADAGHAVEVEPAQFLHELADLADQRLRRGGQAGLGDSDFAGQVGVLDPVVEAPALERLVQLARPVGGDQ